MDDTEKKEVQNMIDLAGSKNFRKRIGDTPTEAYHLVPKKYVDENATTITVNGSVLTGNVVFQASSNLGVVSSGSVITYYQSVVGAPVTNIQVFDTSSVWTMPTAAKEIFIEGWGGGGGSGGTIQNNQSPGGGGSGYMYRWVPASVLTASVLVVVGTGGGAGSVGSGIGSNGLNSYFGSILTAYGGNGGPAGFANGAGPDGGGLLNSAVFVGQPGAISYVGLIQDYGGGGGGGVSTGAGQTGGNSLYGSGGGGAGSTGTGSPGGTSRYDGGAGGSGGDGGASILGSPGNPPGGGGGGSGSSGAGSKPGADGANGRIRVITFF